MPIGNVKQFTDVEFCGHYGVLCPYCRSDDLEIVSNKVAIEEDGTLFLPIKCKACGKRWNESYKLVGYEDCNEEGEYLLPQLHKTTE